MFKWAHRTVFPLSLCKNRLVLQEFFNLGEEVCFLIVVVRLDKLEPGQTVSDEISPICFLDMGNLVVDRVVPSNDGVV